MKRTIKVVVADPAGNITYFVRDSFDRKDYAKVANQLLEMKLDGKTGEQVAFILEAPKCGRARGKMEMCGLEFCGNASRSFALLTARDLESKNVERSDATSNNCEVTGSEDSNSYEKGQIKMASSVSVDVSGVNEILDVKVDTASGYTKIKMPVPLRVFDEIILESPSKIVDFGGIMHLIVKNIEATKETFDQYKDYVNKKYNPPAMGVMFWNEAEKKLVPVVYVKDVDTTYFEGSCGSGTTACCIAFGLGDGEGEHIYSFPQPAGTIDASCMVRDGKVEEVFIEGPVSLSDDIEVEIEL